MTYYRNPKIKKVTIDYNRMDLDEDRLDGPKADYGVTAIGYHKAMELLAMAMEGIVPNGHYSDFECQIWSGFKMILYHEGVEHIYDKLI